MSSSPSPLNPQPEIRLTRAETYRENYANSVQLKVSLWDFQFVFATVQQNSAELVELEGFQGIYMSPQQAKALHAVLSQNLAQYEKTFGPLALEPRPGAPAPAQITPAGGVN